MKKKKTRCIISTRNISGENDVKEIPVPMPNTEVKLCVPTILGGFLPGKIGLRQFIFLVSSVGRALGC